MIRRIAAFALYQPLFVVLGLVLFIGIGIAAFQSLPVEAFPDVTDTQVTVVTLYPGRAPEEVEKQVTVPLEIAMAGIPNSIRMFSHTQFGLSFIVITFDDKPSLFMARQLVQERLRGLDLPPGVEPDLAPPATATGEIYRYRLTAPHLKPVELRTLQDWTVVRQLKQVPGIADVVSLGGPVKQYEVRPNLAKLRDSKITLGQLFTALSRANANSGGGSVAQGRQQFLIRGIGLLRSSADIGLVVVAENKGTPILVRDLAEVIEATQPEQGIVGYNDEDDVVSGIVLLRKDENPSLAIEALKAKVAQLNQSGLPKGVEIKPFYDRSWLISKTLTTVFSNLVEGALLVTAVLYLFLANVRAAAIVALVIPLALLGTFIGLTLMKIPANLLSLGAMDFGIIVDGAVIVIENIFRRLGEGASLKNAKPRVQIIEEAVAEVGRPTVFAMIIIIVAHLPIFTMQRHEGKIFAPMAYSVVAALIVALIASLTLVPFFSKVALTGPIPHEENFLMRWFHRGYEPSLKWALGHTRSVLTAALLALGGALALVPFLGTEFLPELNEGSIWINMSLPPSVSVDEAKREMRKLRKLVGGFPEVSAVVSKAGRPDDGTDPKNINMAEMLIELKPDAEWRPGMTKDKLIREMEDKINDIPGVEPTFSQPVRDQILESISQIDGQIVIKIFGDDLGVLREQGHQLIAKVATVPGVVRAFIDREGELPQYLLEIDRAAAARYGLNVADIQDVIETVLAGKAATQLWEGEKHVGVVVRLPEEQRALDRLKDVLVPTPGGAQIPLANVVKFKLASGAMNIARENGQRVLALFLSGIPLSVSAAIGFIALFGQAVLNGVVMVTYFNQLKAQGLDSYQAVLQGSLTRLRTVLMTAMLAMLGLLPMALSHGIGSETQRPLALVVIGGLMSATLLTLFVLPTLWHYVATHPRLSRALH